MVENAASIRRYITIVEGEMIPLPDKTIRIAASTQDMYQITKMIANPNLAHKVNFTFIGNGTKHPGANAQDMVVVFFDDDSKSETMRLLDHFHIAYSDGAEVGSEQGRQVSRFKSKHNAPTDGDELYGRYFKPDRNPL